MKNIFKIMLIAGLVGVLGFGEVFCMKTPSSSAPPLQKSSSKILGSIPDLKIKPSEGQSEFARRKAVFERRNTSPTDLSRRSRSETRASTSVSSHSSGTSSVIPAPLSERVAVGSIGRSGDHRSIVKSDSPVQTVKTGEIRQTIVPVVSTVSESKPSSSSAGTAVKVEFIDPKKSKLDHGKKLERTTSASQISRPHFEKPQFRKTKSEISLKRTKPLVVTQGSGKKTKTSDAAEGTVQHGEIQIAPAVIKPTITPTPSKVLGSSKLMKAKTFVKSVVSKKGQNDDMKKKLGAAAAALLLGAIAVDDDDDGDADAVVGPAPTQEVVEKPVDVSSSKDDADIGFVGDGDGGFGFN